MYIVVGLGNPGKKYDVTRHNIGFEVVEELARENQIKINKTKFKSLIGEGNIGSEKVVLMKPQTYMNLSGEAVMKAMEFYKVPIEHLIVIYDDIDVEFAKIRIRKKGSGGSHNGMRNIIYLLKDDQFPRVRMGVGRPYPNQPLADFVLQRFSKSEQEEMMPVVRDSVKAIETIIREDVDLAMNRFNKK
ncbi:MAG: aminoacyl-tRNA hydrolase [Clostridia bacterium]|nr:aminoacyl-tRNA hydrolase [Clostridia bacterium]